MMMPPPTHTIAAVPTMLSTARSTGIPSARPRPRPASAAGPCDRPTRAGPPTGSSGSGRRAWTPASRCARAQPGVIGLHDQRNGSHHRGDADAGRRQDHRLGPGVRRNGGQRDRHDLGGEDEVGLSRPPDLLVFQTPGSCVAAAIAASCSCARWGQSASTTPPVPS